MISSTLSSHEASRSFPKVLELHCLNGLNHVKKVLFSYVLFHALFILFFTLQITALAILYFLGKAPAVFSIAIFSLVLSVFTYLVLIFYFQAKKQDQFKLLKEWFLSVCKQSIGEGLSVTDYHLCLAQALYTFATMFHTKDLPSYLTSLPISSFQKLMKKCSYLWHSKDFQSIRKLLILDCIYEHLSLLKYEPTNLEVHASLANSYLTLASVYQMMYRQEQSNQTNAPQLSEKALKNFQNAIYKAIEEYSIIYSSAPHDPWVLAQLASCYHELEMYNQEIAHFEKILEITEPNLDIMLRLAYLYFQEGHTAQGFKLYKLIKDMDEKKADDLFDYYISKAQENSF